jgi:hypothetical protein
MRDEESDEWKILLRQRDTRDLGLSNQRNLQKRNIALNRVTWGQAAGDGAATQITGLRASTFKKTTRSYCCTRIISRRERGSNLTEHGNLRSDFYASLTGEFGMIYLFAKKSSVLWNLHKGCGCESD